jgi:hypothetical protein
LRERFVRLDIYLQTRLEQAILVTILSLGTAATSWEKEDSVRNSMPFLHTSRNKCLDATSSFAMRSLG